MRLSSVLVALFAILAGAVVCVIAAVFAVGIIEDNSEINVRRALDSEKHEWAEVEANGLQLTLTGTAPDEATRFNALSTVGTVVDAARIIDAMEVAPTADLAPPRFSAEILRNESGISIIGLVPAKTDREALVQRLTRTAGTGQVADLLETANHKIPQGWGDSLEFALDALDSLPRSKISVEAGRVEITAMAESAEQQQQLEDKLTRAAPPGLRLALDVVAPRPVITPFTLRFLIDESGSRFDACSADTDASKDRILRAAAQAGLQGEAECTVGMGVPSANWARAAELAIRAVSELGEGSVTIADADVTLVAAQGISSDRFDRVVGELDTALPDVFALHAVLPDPADPTSSGPPEFVATLSPEGLVQLRGRVSDETLRQMADSYAKARFGSTSVYTATRVVSDLPANWSVRVLAGLEALSYLDNGVVTVTPDAVSLSGASSREDARSKVAQLLSDKLGETETYDLSVTYVPPPEPVDRPPSPDECEARLKAAQDVSKIAFEPGSATITEGSRDTMDQIAEILTECGEIRLEIQGHTDSQGREVMNQQLSQARAQSVLNELRARRVLTRTYSVVGYGESQPIADNDTEEGREDNRRIEFHLIRPEPIPETQTTLESVASQDGNGTDADGTAEGDAEVTEEGDADNEQN